MFVDYLTLMLVNLAAALFLYALYMAFFHGKDDKKMIPGFLLTGALALITGLMMSLTWPLPGGYNIVFGEPTVLLGALFFMTGLALQFEWDLLTIGIFALGAGAIAILLGIRVLDMRLTSEPEVAAAGYILAGLASALALPVFTLPNWKWVRWVAAIIALVAAGVWVFVGFSSYWAHPNSFSKWQPDSMLSRLPPAAPSK